MAMTRDYFELASALRLGLGIGCGDSVAAVASIRAARVDRFLANFDIEILRSVRGVAPHHRSPTSAAKPAGQDLGTPSASGMADTTAPNTAECQSFLDNLIAQFWNI
jgi:hypothetical protein